MNRLKHASLIWKLLPIVIISLLLNTGIAQAGQSWKLISGVNPSTIYNNVSGVNAISSNDVWAVGAYSQTKTTQQPLIEHWNGSTWKVVPSPTPDLSNNQLYAVASTSTQDVWAVGQYYSNAQANQETLIDHWNGTQWTVIPSPNESSSYNSLYGIAAISPTNAWAVGDYTNDFSDFTEPLIEHWNGSTWAIVTSPQPGTLGSTLSAVAALSANSIWAVGYLYDPLGNPKTLIEYWNGTKWAVVHSPNPVILSNTLLAVTAISASDVWAVGQYQAKKSFNTLIEHWNGTSWSVVSSPNPGSQTNTLNGVAAVSAHNIWAVGSEDSGLGGRTLVEHWNGTRWSVVSSPNAGSGDNTLFAVARVPSTEKAWAAGQYSGTISQTLFVYHP